MKTRAASRPNRYAADFMLSTVLAGLFFIGCVGTESTKKDNAASNEDEIEVGYGTTYKGHIVGAVATVDGNDAQKDQPRNLAEMLLGRTAGVQVSELPGGGIRVGIRGRVDFQSKRCRRDGDLRKPRRQRSGSGQNETRDEVGGR